VKSSIGRQQASLPILDALAGEIPNPGGPNKMEAGGDG